MLVVDRMFPIVVVAVPIVLMLTAPLILIAPEIFVVDRMFPMFKLRLGIANIQGGFYCDF